MRAENSFRTIEECLVEWLQKDLSRAEEFLHVALESYLLDNEFDELLHSLQCIASARGDSLELVDSSEVDQEGLDKLLKVDINLSWEKVLAVLGYAHLEASGESIFKVV